MGTAVSLMYNTLQMTEGSRHHAKWGWKKLECGTVLEDKNKAKFSFEEFNEQKKRHEVTLYGKVFKKKNEINEIRKIRMWYVRIVKDSKRSLVLNKGIEIIPEQHELVQEQNFQLWFRHWKVYLCQMAESDCIEKTVTNYP